MNLVVIPFHDWKKCEQEGFRTRDAHLMQEFGKHPQVSKLLVINRPISWAEMLLLKRPRYPQQGQLIYAQNGVYISQVGEKTYTLDMVIPEFWRPLWMKRDWIPVIFGKPQVARHVNQTLAQLEMTNDYNLFFSAPLFVPLVKNLNPSIWILDAQDNLLKHALYQHVPNLSDFYDFCLENADFVSANSLETTKWFQKKRADAVWISNGVDAEKFSPNESYPLPADLDGIKSPIVGYAGKMQEMLDIEAIELAVKNLPHINFVFIGQQLNPKWVQHLWQYPNVHYLGDKPYSLLPQYLAAFDICIIPYSIERQHGVDPIKFYEYLAMGKPIVTTDIGGVADFREYPQVRIAQTAEQFVAGVRQMINLIQTDQPFDTKPVPPDYLWKTKADQIIQAMQRS